MRQPRPAGEPQRSLGRERPDGRRTRLSAASIFLPPADSTFPQDALNTPPERWQSGRSHRTRNAAYGQPYRGFKSLPLRHLPACGARRGLPKSRGGGRLVFSRLLDRQKRLERRAIRRSGGARRACSPDGAKRNPGTRSPQLGRSLIVLRFTRATAAPGRRFQFIPSARNSTPISQSDRQITWHRWMRPRIDISSLSGSSLGRSVATRAPLAEMSRTTHLCSTPPAFMRATMYTGWRGPRLRSSAWNRCCRRQPASRSEPDRLGSRSMGHVSRSRLPTYGGMLILVYCPPLNRIARMFGTNGGGRRGEATWRSYPLITKSPCGGRCSLPRSPPFDHRRHRHATPACRAARTWRPADRAPARSRRRPELPWVRW